MSEIINQNEVSINISETEKINSLREFTTSPKGQEKMVSFIENLKTELGNKEGWLNTCQKAESELQAFPINEILVSKINNTFSLFINQMPPGHDRGHFSRDLLNSIVLYESIKDQVAFKSDALVGLLAGSFHDIGTSIIPRYQDNKYGAGHGETGSYLFWQISDGILGKNTRKLVSYAIAAHSHYLKPIQSQLPTSYKKDKYWDDTWVNKNNKLNGVAIQTTRRSDRADTNGITHMFRHILASVDAVEAGGKDFSGDNWFELNQESLLQILNPTVRTPAGNPPTTLEHVYRFIKSNDGSNPYSEKDYLFPSFKEILALKIPQVDKLMENMGNSIDINDNPENQKFIHDLFYKVSKSDSQRFEKAWKNFQSVWSKLSPESRSKWYNGFKYSEDAYNKLLDFYQSKTKGSEFSNIANQIIKTIS